MADQKISTLPAASAALMADEFFLSDALSSAKMTFLSLQPTLTPTNASTTTQTLITSVNRDKPEWLAGSGILIPEGGLKAKTLLRWVFELDKTGGSPQLLFRIATSKVQAGDGSLGALLDIGNQAATGNASTATCVLTVVVRNVGTAAVLVSNFALFQSAAATGYTNHTSISVTTVHAPIDTTWLAGHYIGLTLTASQTAPTCKLMSAHADNMV